MKKLIVVALLYSLTSLASINSLSSVPMWFQEQQEIKEIAQLHVDLLKKCKKQTKHVSNTLLAFLTELSDIIAYWKLQKIKPLRYFISRGPLKWFSSIKQYEEVDAAITFLEQEYDRLFYFLGRLNLNASQLEVTLNMPVFLEKVQQQLTLIDACLNFSQKRNKSSEDIAFENVYRLYQKNNDNLLRFDQKFHEYINPYQIPMHLRRYWLEYSMLLAGGIVASHYAHQNPDHIQQTVTNFGDYVMDLIQTKIVSPIRKAWDVLFKFEKPKHDIDIVKEALHHQAQIKAFEELAAQEKESARIQFHNYCKEAHPEKSPAEVDIEFNKSIEQYWSDLLLKDFNEKEMKNPVYNIIRGKLIKLIALRASIEYLHPMKQFMVQIANSYYKVDNLINSLQGDIEAHSITRAVCLVGPILGVIFATGYISKKLISKMMPIDTSNQKIQKVVHLIHRTINIYPSQKKRISHINNGKIIYWVHCLKKLAKNIDVDFQEIFNQDCKLLASFELTREQKLVAIEQMYRNYRFLNII